MMVFFTDGITEARRGREFFGVEGLTCAAQKAAAPQVSLPLIGTAILEEVSRFSGGRQTDDICLMLLRRSLAF